MPFKADIAIKLRYTLSIYIENIKVRLYLSPFMLINGLNKEESYKI